MPLETTNSVSANNSQIEWPTFRGNATVDERGFLPSPEALLSVFGYDNGPLIEVKRINGSSRNPVYRLSGEQNIWSFIAKFYLPGADPFYDSRFRREEKVLTLLNKWYSEHVPRIHGGIITQTYGVILQENMGDASLDDLLRRAATPDVAYHMAETAVDLLVGFHSVCMEHFDIFNRTIRSVDLDRLTMRTLVRRACIALGRLALMGRFRTSTFSSSDIRDLSSSTVERLGMELVGREFFRIYHQEIIHPLMKAPRQIIHNSFSPFHLVFDARFTIIDFETMSLGPAQVDLAELLGAPTMVFSKEEKLQLAKRYYEQLRLKGRAAEESWETFHANLERALISRSLDYLGTTAIRYVRQMQANSSEAAQINYDAARHYLKVIQTTLVQEKLLNVLDQKVQLA